mmetsp:Transcript_20288/g.45289  ORF Transcript_20288/g.45289 Transcript_20288/m.45289 type:complete len:176 (+) Transcript_20288:537-1064(+)
MGAPVGSPPNSVRVFFTAASSALAIAAASLSRASTSWYMLCCCCMFRMLASLLRNGSVHPHLVSEPCHDVMTAHLFRCICPCLRRVGSVERVQDTQLAQTGCKWRYMDTKEAADECPICLDVFCSDAIVCTLPCAHTYHAECISAWFARSSRCPLCKFDVARQASEDDSGDSDTP